MTLYQFNSFDEMQQMEAFWEGILVGKRKEGELKYECRQINDFYVEYRIIVEQFYADMRSFRNPDLLQPYFDAMGKLEM